MPSPLDPAHDSRFKQVWLSASTGRRWARRARAAALVGVWMGAAVSHGISANPTVAVDAISEPFADDSMTRQSTSALYQVDELPPPEMPASASVLSPQPYRISAVRRHRHVHHELAKQEPAPEPAKPKAHEGIALKFFTWWNHLVKGHSWAQVPWAPNDKNPSPKHVI